MVDDGRGRHVGRAEAGQPEVLLLEEIPLDHLQAAKLQVMQNVYQMPTHLSYSSATTVSLHALRRMTAERTMTSRQAA